MRIARLVVEHFAAVAIAADRDLAELRLAVAVVIDADIAFGDEHPLGRRVERVAAHQGAFLIVPPRHGLGRIGVHVERRDGVDQLGVIALFDQRRARCALAVRHKDGVFAVAGARADKELFGRDGDDLDLTRLLDALDLDVMQHRHGAAVVSHSRIEGHPRRGAWRGRSAGRGRTSGRLGRQARCYRGDGPGFVFVLGQVVCRLGRVIAERRRRVFGMFDRFDLFVRQELRQLVVGQTLVFFLGLFLALIPPQLDRAHLLQKGVLDPIVEDGETVVVAGKNPVAVIGGLICDLFVFRALGLELHYGIARGEYLKQARQDAFDHVRDIGRDDGRLPLDFVAERPAQ